MGGRVIGALAATVAVGLLGPAVGMAQAPLPVGEAEGVRIERRPDIVFLFTQRAKPLWKRVAGKRLRVECVELPEDGPGPQITSSGVYLVRVPAHKRRVGTGDVTPGIDYCSLWRPARTVRRSGERTRIGRRELVSIPLTQKGAVYLDERAKTRKLLRALLISSFIAEKLKLTTYPTYDQIVEVVGGRLPGIVPLPSPADTPPRGRVGYFSDGQEHLAVVTVTASGRRLFVELQPDDVLHTNVAGYVFDAFD